MSGEVGCGLEGGGGVRHSSSSERSVTWRRRQAATWRDGADGPRHRRADRGLTQTGRGAAAATGRRASSVDKHEVSGPACGVITAPPPISPDPGGATMRPQVVGQHVVDGGSLGSREIGVEREALEAAVGATIVGVDGAAGPTDELRHGCPAAARRPGGRRASVVGGDDPGARSRWTGGGASVIEVGVVGRRGVLPTSRTATDSARLRGSGTPPSRVRCTTGAGGLECGWTRGSRLGPRGLRPRARGNVEASGDLPRCQALNGRQVVPLVPRRA